VYIHKIITFWPTVNKTVRPMLSDRCLSVCLSVLSSLRRWCIVAKRLDGSRYETWHGDRGRYRHRPRPHCVRWGLPPQKGVHSQFSAHVYCGQTAGWIKMSFFDTEVGLGPDDIVLDWGGAIVLSLTNA